MNGFKPGGENCALILGAFDAANTMHALGFEGEFRDGLVMAAFARVACLNNCPKLGSCGAELEVGGPTVEDTGLSLGEIASGFRAAARIGNCGAIVD